MQIIPFFFANQEYVFSVLVGGDYFLPHLTEASIWVKVGFP